MERSLELERAGGTMSKRRKLQHPYDRVVSSEEEAEEDEAAAGGGRASVDEVEEEDDDDDLPPPVVHRWKLKEPHRVKEEASTVELAVDVPRKLRTAMSKRCRETSSGNPKKPSSNGTLPPSNLSLDASLKSGKKTKSSNHSKPRQAKMVKISPSKQEVEVAETLYDLARMFVNQTKPTLPAKEDEAEPSQEQNPQTKFEQVFTATAAPLSQSTEHTPPGMRRSVTATSSTSSIQTPGQLGAPKRIHNSTTKACGKSTASASASPCLSASSLVVTTEMADAEQVQQHTEPAKSTPAIPLVTQEPTFKTGSPSSAETNGIKKEEIMANNSIITAAKKPEVEACDHVRVEVANTKHSIDVVDKDCIVSADSVLTGNVTTDETREMLVQSPLTESAQTKKLQIDLMAASEPNDCKVDEYKKCGIIDEKKKEELKLPTVAAVIENGFSIKDEDKNKLEQKSIETKIYNEDRQFTEKGEDDRCKDEDLEEDIQEVRESCQTKDFLRDKVMLDRDNQSTESGGKIIIGDSKPLKDGYDSAPMPPMITRVENSVTSIPLTISLDVISWPSGIPNSGFYSLTPGADAASSHPSSLCVPILPSKEVKPALAPVLQPPLSKMHSLRKHCVMHVYITHFIDFQQCLKENTSLHSAYRDSNPLCGVQRYNTNGSVAFPNGSFGNNKENDLIGVSICNTHGLDTGSSKSTIDFIKEKAPDPRPPVLDAEDVQGRKDAQPRSHIDHLIKKTASQQQAQTVQQQTASPFQIGASFGFPITQMDTASTVKNTAAGDIGLTSSISRGGSSMPSNNLSVGTAIGLSTGNVSNIVSSQTQFLSPIVQHPTFPFSFPPSKVASSYGSHIPAQEAAHFFSNPLYGAQLAQQPPHPLQLQEIANMSSRTSDPHKQQHQQSPSICSFASLGSLQQLPWPPAHGDRILIADQLQQSQELNGKYSTAAEPISSSETKMSAAPSNIYKPNLNSMQSAILNSPSQLLPSTMYSLTVCPQDLNLMGAIGGNEHGNLQQKPEMRVQPLHSVSQLRQHQQLHVPTQLQVVSPLQMSLKDAESRASQSLSTMSINGGPPNAGVLELSAVSSVVAPQGHTFFHNIGSQNRISVLEKSVSGQPQQQQQSQNQQPPTHMQILASRGFDDDKTNTSGGSYHYGKSGYVDDKKGPVQYQISHPYLEASNCLQGSPTERTYNFTSNCISPQSLMVTCPGTSVASNSASISVQHPSHSSKKQMARSKAAPGSNISSSQVESTAITFLDRSPVHAANFANVSSVQGFPFTGQNVDAHTQCRSPGHSQQSAQMKVIQRASVGSPLHLTPGSPSQNMLAVMARTKGQMPNSEPSGLDNSRNSPAPSASSFSGTTLPHSPASTSGGAAVSKNSSAKDSYSNSHREKSSSAATSAAIVPNTSLLFGANTLYQHLPSNLQAQMVESQPRLQKKQPQKKQQRKQPKISQGLPQQFPQYMVSPQQQPYNYHLQQTLSNQQSHLLPSHASSQVASQNLEFGDVQQQPIKHIHYQQVQIQQQSPQYLQQHQQTLSSPFGIVTNGVVPSAIRNNVGYSARNFVSDGALLSQTGVLRPSTPMNFTLSTSVPSTSQRSSVSRPVILNSEDGPIRSGPINQQQTYPSFSNPGLQSIPNPGTPGKPEKSMTGN